MVVQQALCCSGSAAHWTLLLLTQLRNELSHSCALSAGKRIDQGGCQAATALLSFEEVDAAAITPDNACVVVQVGGGPAGALLQWLRDGDLQLGHGVQGEAQQLERLHCQGIVPDLRKCTERSVGGLYAEGHVMR